MTFQKYYAKVTEWLIVDKRRQVLLPSYLNSGYLGDNRGLCRGKTFKFGNRNQYTGSANRQRSPSVFSLVSVVVFYVISPGYGDMDTIFIRRFVKFRISGLDSKQDGCHLTGVYGISIRHNPMKFFVKITPKCQLVDDQRYWITTLEDG